MIGPPFFRIEVWTLSASKYTVFVPLQESQQRIRLVLFFAHHAHRAPVREASSVTTDRTVRVTRDPVICERCGFVWTPAAHKDGTDCVIALQRCPKCDGEHFTELTPHAAHP